MMYNDVRVGEIPILSFLRGTDYAMYVGPMLSSSEHEALRKLDISIPVIYLPEVLEGLTESRMKYNFPGVTLPESLTVENVYAQIRSEFDGKITEKSRLIIKYNGDVLMMYDAKESGGSFGQLLSFLRDRYASYMSYGRNVSGSRRLLKSQHNEILDELRRHAGEMDFEKIFENIYLAKIKPCLEESVCSRTSEGEYDSISDYHFQSDMDVAARDAQGMIENLLLNGCPPEMILQWVNQSVKISRLRITRHFKIFLTDYDNAEVKMGPLPKTVFLFFLRHPEGVMFSHLMDHRKELQMIYERVCTNDDPQKMHDSIKRLTDPLDNSISEKCAAVKKAFILNIADNIACNYYISGAQGEKKGISLDRSFVDWECEI